MSVYGTLRTDWPVSEEDRAAPNEPYGASKLAVELIGHALSKQKKFEFVALRIARVVGPGIKKTSSPWRCQIFESRTQDSVSIPFAPEAVLSLVHVEEVARMLLTLTDTAGLGSSVYNTPVELWEARRLKQVVEELRGIRIQLGHAGPDGGPICNGNRFAREFGFQLRSLRERLSS
jgi:nucleoside-diphosphate-sugar epimerase